MATWKQPGFAASATERVQEFIGPVAEDLRSIVENTREVINTVGPAVDAILAILAIGNPVTAGIQAAMIALNQLIEDFFNADIFMLPWGPTSPAGLLRPHTMPTAIQAVTASINDQRDPNRPLFSRQSAYASITIVAGTDNWADFIGILEGLGRIFAPPDYNRWKRLADIRIDFDNFRRLNRADRNSQGTPWDWERTNWMDVFPVIGEAARTVQEFLQGLVNAGQGIAETVQLLLNAIEERLIFIDDVLTTVVNILDVLEDITQLVPQLHYLVASNTAVPPADDNFGATGGTADFVNQLTTSQNQPDFKLVAGVTFATFTGNPLATMRELAFILGVQLDNLEDV